MSKVGCISVKCTLREKKMAALSSTDKNSPRVNEDELHVKTRPEHKHGGMHFDLGDGAGRQRVADRD